MSDNSPNATYLRVALTAVVLTALMYAASVLIGTRPVVIAVLAALLAVVLNE